MSLLLSKSERGIIIFHVWKNLDYSLRITLSFILIFSGFFIQYQMFSIFPGILLVFSGNLFLLVKGYDNRIKLGSFRAEAEWVTTGTDQLEKIIELNQKVKKWDISALDVSNALGFLLFFVSTLLLLVFFLINPFRSQAALNITVANAAVLIFLHWFTGIKRITTLPALINKIKIFLILTDYFGKYLKNDTIKFLMLVKGKDIKMPADVKMKINFKDQPEEFLGLYAQINMNNVQGQDYPYFYVVLVAKEKSDLISRYGKNINVPKNIITEYKQQDDAEILDIRQFTTKTSGYHTNGAVMQIILKTGIDAARKVLNNR